MSKKVVLVLALLAILAINAVHANEGESDTETQVEAEAEADVDRPAGKPRKGASLTAAKVPNKLRYGHHERVVYVPKGDPRAKDPNPPRPHHRHHRKEQRVVVEAEDVTRPEGEDHHHTRHQVGKMEQHMLLKAGAPSSAGACLAHWNGATAAAKAKQYQANYKSRGVKYSQPYRQFGITAKYSDCSSFVTSILNDIGMDCLFAAGRNTMYMNSQIRTRGGYKQTAQVGDIVMWGGHTGMITEVCGNGRYTMTAMGLHGAGLAVCQTVTALKAWGSGGWLGFWTPRP